MVTSHLLHLQFFFLFLSKIYKVPCAAVASWALFFKISINDAVQITLKQVICL